MQEEWHTHLLWASILISRTADIAGFALPDWQAVLDRDYEPWDRERLILDRATLSVTQSVEKIVAALAKPL